MVIIKKLTSDDIGATIETSLGINDLLPLSTKFEVMIMEDDEAVALFIKKEGK